MYVSMEGGWLEVICGSMFSGKSEELIRRIRRTYYAKQHVAIFKPKIDDRYSEASVVSHDGNEIVAEPIDSIESIEHRSFDEYDVVAIDEAQFFDDSIIAFVTKLANEGKRVIVAGLDQDFKGEPFGPMPHLLAIAEHVTKLQAVCSVCGAPASRTQRLIDGQPASVDDPVILVGASESYEPRCRVHHVIGSAGTIANE